MPHFDVIVTVDVTQSAIVRVEAEDADSATQQAIDGARDDGAALTWENDDTGSWKPYIADWDTAATLVEPQPSTPTVIQQAAALAEQVRELVGGDVTLSGETRAMVNHLAARLAAYGEA